MALLKRRLARAAAAATGFWLAMSLGSACFSPRMPGCAFSCVSDGRCPSGYSCASDGLCHRDDGVGTCDLPSQTDGGSDAMTDAGSDVPTD